MSGGIPPLPPYVFMAWCVVRHRDNFTLKLASEGKRKCAENATEVSQCLWKTELY
jgi:hypothetical protein